MTDYLARPDKQLFRQPYLMEGAKLAGFIIQGKEGSLQKSFVDPILNAATSPNRFRDALDDHCILAFVHYPQLRHAEDDWGYFRYNEFTLLMPVRDTDPKDGKEMYLFTPLMAVDSVFPLILGREIYGFPKIFGEIECGPFASTSPSGRCRASVQGFARRDPHEECGMQRIVDAYLPFAHLFSADSGEWTSEMAAGLFAFMPWPTLVNDFVHEFMHDSVPVLFLKEFPSGETLTRACYRRLVWADTKPDSFSTFDLQIGTVVIHNPASFPLADMLGFNPGRTPGLVTRVPHGIAPAFTTTFNWEIPPAQELQ